MIEGLPFQNDVQRGRDLRGSSFPGAQNIDLSYTDLSYCSKLGSFRNCNLDYAKLDYINGNIYDITGQFHKTSFFNAKLQKVYLDRSSFINCNFDKSDLKSAYFRGSDLRESSFLNANCEFADFQECDIRGCNFQNANLRGAMFRAVKLDKTTDLRGANLCDIVHEEQRDFSEELVLTGTDWKKATYNDSTKYGKDERSFEKELLKHIYKEALKDKKEWSVVLAEEIKNCIKQLNKLPDFKWYEELLKKTEGFNQNEIKEFLEQSSMGFS